MHQLTVAVAGDGASLKVGILGKFCQILLRGKTATRHIIPIVPIIHIYSHSSLVRPSSGGGIPFLIRPSSGGCILHVRQLHNPMLHVSICRSPHVVQEGVIMTTKQLSHAMPCHSLTQDGVQHVLRTVVVVHDDGDFLRILVIPTLLVSIHLHSFRNVIHTVIDGSHITYLQLLYPVLGQLMSTVPLPLSILLTLKLTPRLPPADGQPDVLLAVIRISPPAL